MVNVLLIQVSQIRTLPPHPPTHTHTHRDNRQAQTLCSNHETREAPYYQTELPPPRPLVPTPPIPWRPRFCGDPRAGKDRRPCRLPPLPPPVTRGVLRGGSGGGARWYGGGGGGLTRLSGGGVWRRRPRRLRPLGTCGAWVGVRPRRRLASLTPRYCGSGASRQRVCASAAEE
jgi:hypothetical protein